MKTNNLILVSFSSLLLGACSLMQNKAVIEIPDNKQNTFGHGIYSWSDEGYFISDLSLPKQKTLMASGCDKPLLVADLSEPVKEGDAVKSINVPCGDDS